MTDRKNMSIMELAYQILFENERSMTFNELFEAICTEKGIDEQQKAVMVSQVYTDFISSAKFIYVGDDEWDVKGRRAIELWDKDGAYYDEYPDYEEELTLFEDEKDEYSIDTDVKLVEEDEDEDESIYEKDIDEDDIEDDDSDYDAFVEDEEEYEEEADLDFEEDLDEEDLDPEVEENQESKAPVEEIFEDEEEFEEEEYNEYMDDYEEMYED